MPDYQNGKIYTIRCRSDNTLIYVGSTTMTLSRRMAEHRYASVSNNIKKLYSTVNGNWDDWYIELYEEFPCDNKEQLCRREGGIIREIGTLNRQIAGRTRKEYGKESYENHQDERLEVSRQYRINNPEKVKLAKQKYRENNIDEIKLYEQEYRENNAEKFKNYYENNAEKLKLYQQEYYENNPEKLKENITCECGCIIRRREIARHLKTKRHIEGINPV